MKVSISVLSLSAESDLGVRQRDGPPTLTHLSDILLAHLPLDSGLFAAEGSNVVPTPDQLFDHVLADVARRSDLKRGCEGRR